MSRVYFVRHGETEANSQRIIQGHLDIELNELGHKQAGVVAERLRHVPLDMAFSSDLSRAMKTAEPTVSDHQGITLELHKDLRGQFMGNLEGKVFTPGITIPVDETIENGEVFMERVHRWWSEYLLKHLASLPPKLDEAPHEILVVSHGAVIAILVQKLTGQHMLTCTEGVVRLVSPSPNTSISVVEVETDGRAVVKEYGDAFHLGVDAIDGGGMRN
ncbi:phosphoglycerate mutase-like protein [Amanita muscaria]